MKEYRDHYFLKAKRENYPARSVYKLKELDAKFKLFRQGMRVLDLGAAPGSWSLGAAEKVGQRGRVLGCDIQTTETAFPPQVTFMQEDVFNRNDAIEARLREAAKEDTSTALETPQPDAAELAREDQVFGRNIFNTRNLTFEPSVNLATPPNYRLGPGDEVIIDI